jgi:ribosomal protein S12 methylthiotransferase accessory factor
VAGLGAVAFEMRDYVESVRCIELWHVEHAYPPVIAHHVPGRELSLPYRVVDLDTVPGSLVSESTPLDWVAATGMTRGRTTPVPIDVVCLTRPDRRRWTPIGFRRSSNGLASGNSWEEAALHALYEVIERDAIRGQPWDHQSQHVDPGSVTDAGCAAMLAKLRSAGTVFEIAHVPNRFRVPCFAARVWSEDLPVTCLGFGAHLAADVALSRAVSEAAQGRLTAITGSREDLPPVYEQVRQGGDERPRPVRGWSTWAELTAGLGAGCPDLGEELTRVCAIVAGVLGTEPLLVDLSTEDDFSVVKVIVPGAGSDLERFHAPG